MQLGAQQARHAVISRCRCCCPLPAAASKHACVHTRSPPATAPTSSTGCSGRSPAPAAAAAGCHSWPANAHIERGVRCKSRGGGAATEPANMVCVPVCPTCRGAPMLNPPSSSPPSSSGQVTRFLRPSPPSAPACLMMPFPLGLSPPTPPPLAPPFPSMPAPFPSVPAPWLPPKAAVDPPCELPTSAAFRLRLELLGATSASSPEASSAVSQRLLAMPLLDCAAPEASGV